MPSTNVADFHLLSKHRAGRRGGADSQGIQSYSAENG